MKQNSKLRSVALILFNKSVSKSPTSYRTVCIIQGVKKECKMFNEVIVRTKINKMVLIDKVPQNGCF